MVISHSMIAASPARLSARLPMLSFVSHNRSTTPTLIRKGLSFFVFVVVSAGFGAQSQGNGPLGPQPASVRTCSF